MIRGYFGDEESSRWVECESPGLPRSDLLCAASPRPQVFQLNPPLSPMACYASESGQRQHKYKLIYKSETHEEQCYQAQTKVAGLRVVVQVCLDGGRGRVCSVLYVSGLCLYHIPSLYGADS